MRSILNSPFQFQVAYRHGLILDGLHLQYRVVAVSPTEEHRELVSPIVTPTARHVDDDNDDDNDQQEANDGDDDHRHDAVHP